MSLTKERITEIFENPNSDWNGDNVLQGFAILSKYIDPTKETLLGGADHDVVYGPSIEACIEAGLTEDDAIKLALLNWSANDYDDCFKCYV